MKTKILITLIVVILVAVAAVTAFSGGEDEPTPANNDPRGTVGAAGTSDGSNSTRKFPYKNLGDIVKIAMDEIKYNGLLDDQEGFAPILKGAVVATPVFVQSLDKSEYSDYYMLNFKQQGKVVAVAIVGVDQGKAEFKECHKFDPQLQFPPVNPDEARQLAQRAGKAVGTAQGKLVFKFSAQCPGAVLPAWDFGNKTRIAQNGEVFAEFAPEPKIIGAE